MKTLMLMTMLFWIGLPGTSRITSALAQAPGVEPAPLELNKPLERLMAGDETQVFSLRLEAGQFCEIKFQNYSSPLLAVASGPDGQRLGTVSGKGMTILLLPFITSAAGLHRVEVRVAEKTAARINFTVQLNQLLVATERSEHYVKGWTLFQEGTNQFAQGSPAARRQAVASWEAALPEWRAMDFRRMEASTLRAIGETLQILNEAQRALIVAEEALAIFRELKDRQMEARTLSNIGTAYRLLGNNPKARTALESALEVSRAIGNRDREIGVMTLLGLTYSETGDPDDRGMNYFQQALQLARESKSAQREAEILHNIGLEMLGRGQPYQALNYLQQASKVFRLDIERAICLSNLSNVYHSLNQHQLALDHAQQALEMFRALKNRNREAHALNELGANWLKLGEPQLATQQFTEALTISRKIGDRSEEQLSLMNLGRASLIQKNPRGALETFQQALNLSRQLGLQTSTLPALRYIGQAYVELPDLPAARETLQHALVLSRELKKTYEEADVLLLLGKTSRLSGEKNQAREYLEQSLVLRRGVNSPTGEALALEELAQLALQEGQWQTAREHAAAAARLHDATGSRFTGQELRAGYRHSTQKSYEFWIESLMQLQRLHEEESNARSAAFRRKDQARESVPPEGGTTNTFAAEAFAVSERYRARSLVELLSETRTDIRQGVDAELLRQERDLRERMADKAGRLALLPQTEEGRQRSESIRAEIAALHGEASELAARIRAASPAYAALTQPQPLTLAETQKQIVDASTLLLEYSLGQQRSYLFAVTPNELRVFTLPPRAEIESATRGVFELLNAPGRPPVFRSLAEKQQWLARNQKEYETAASALGQTLLGPASAMLGRKRLLIIGDGVLQQLPFAVLPEPQASKIRNPQSTIRNPLIANHEIVSLPSATTLAVIRREAAARKPAEKTIAVLADPVFDAKDPRLQAKNVGQALACPDCGQTKVRPTSFLQRATSESAFGEAVALERLPASRQEAETISALVPQEQRKIALDFDASRASALGEDLSQYRYLHFATHGLLNGEHPELSGLVFSMVDAQGKEQNGFLRAMEVYNLKLSAELVVLSGCRTGLGKQFNGEGLTGLTRGFMYAGSRRVMASLWPVNDAATGELMKRFYQGLLGSKHLAPAAALREAQLSMQRDRRWQTPYYWGAFVLQGEW